MPPAYLIAEVEVKDTRAYKAYSAATPAVIAKHGGEFIVRGGGFDAKEGVAPGGRVVRFPRDEQALAFHDWQDYAGLLALRLSIAEGRAFIVEGVD